MGKDRAVYVAMGFFFLFFVVAAYMVCTFAGLIGPLPVIEHFKLEPGDPHWMAEIDPNNRLWDRGEFWESNRVDVNVAPKIEFTLPEVSHYPGELTFTYKKDAPGTYLGGTLILYARADNKWIELWRLEGEGPVDEWTEVVVELPAGYKYLRFEFHDDPNSDGYIKLKKSMTVFGAKKGTVFSVR